MSALDPNPIVFYKPTLFPRRLASALTGAPPVNTHHVDVADGVRALSIALIGWFHFWQQSWLEPSFTVFGRNVSLLGLVRTGYMQVDVLLMLSGFLLFLPYARMLLEGGDRPAPAAFYQKRAVRILPSYWMSMAVLLIFALVRHSYPTGGALWFDMWTHLSFTHTLFWETYFNTRYIGVLWTLAIEVQFYLFFPWLARAFSRRPLLCYAVMTGIALLFRYLAQLPFADMHMMINQLPAMLDVYANGMLAALAYVHLAKRIKPNAWVRLWMTAVAAAMLYAIYRLHWTQSHIGTTPQIGYGQMARRFPLSVCAAVFLLSASQAVGWFRWLFANRAMRFFAAISFQFYLWHQFFAVNMRVSWRFPPYQALENPQMAGEMPWQVQYMLLCWVIGIAVSALLTYAWEKPMARVMTGLFNLIKRKAQKRSKFPSVPA